MDIHPIRTEDDYLAAQKIIEHYRDTKPDPASEDGEHFEVLLALIQAHETRQRSVDTPDSIKENESHLEHLGQLTPVAQKNLNYKLF